MGVKFDGMYMHHPANKHEDWYKEKHRKREAYKKFRSHRTSDVKTELEIVEVGKASLCTHRYSQHCALILEKHQCTIQPFKQRGQYEAHPRKWHQMIYYFFPTFAPLPHGTKSNRLNKTYISTKRYSISKVNSSPIWRNTLGHILMNTIAYYPVYFRMLTNNISSNPITHMVVTFYWFLYIDKKIFNICRLLDEIFRD